MAMNLETREAEKGCTIRSSSRMNAGRPPRGPVDGTLPLVQNAAMLSLVLAAAVLADTGTYSPEPERQLAHAVYEELVDIDTSYSTGQTTPAAEAVARRLLEAGFPGEDVVVLGAAPHKANVVARYRGTGKARPLLLLAHLDVVEAKRSDWSMDPFKLVEKDGYFYGRGTGDDKAQAAIWVANLIRMRREAYRPSRDLIVALTADEEGGGPYNGVAWLLKNRRDLIDAELCLNEGGWGEMRDGRRLLNLVQVGEKHSATYRLEVRNPGGHSSMPVPENAIYRLAAAVLKVAALEFPFRLNDVTRAYLTRLADLQPEPLSTQLREAAAGDAEAQRAVAAASPQWNAVMRTTCVATGLDGGHAENALPQTAGARINCRILPDQTPEQVEAALRAAIADEQVQISVTNAWGASPMSPVREDVLGAVTRITSQMWPGVATLPYMVMGGTDGSSLRRAGIPSYGVQGIFFDAGDIRFHGRDERVGVREFYEGQEFLYRLVKALSR
jgi:acetylornithine deacetylase/succinyl-diaminopimelate desuccinylase-like protein